MGCLELAGLYCRYQFLAHRDPSDEIGQWNENFQTYETSQKFDNHAIDEDSDLYASGICCPAWRSTGARHFLLHDFCHPRSFTLGRKRSVRFTTDADSQSSQSMVTGSQILTTLYSAVNTELVLSKDGAALFSMPVVRWLRTPDTSSSQTWTFGETL